MDKLTIQLMVLSTIYMCTHAAATTNSVVKYFTDDVNNGNFNHLVVDENTDRVYVGAVNMLYMLTDDLGLSKTYKTGPEEDSPNCPPPPDECSCSTNCEEYEKRPVNSINKGLLIDYHHNRLIVCMNIYQGHCEKRHLNDISVKDEMPFHPPVVPNDADSSVVMFIAPGPSKKDALYVGATRSTQGLPLYIDQVPAISTRNMTNFELTYADPLGASTKMEIETQHKDIFKVDYIYGFSSEGFSYFLVVQPDDIASEYFGTRVIRVCQNDSKYTSYMEMPLTCEHEGINYNLLRSAYVAKPGTNLAQDLGLPHIPPLDDVLFASFAKSEPPQSKIAGRDSVLCVFTLRAIRQVFTRTVQECFKGTGNTGPAHIISPETCIRVQARQFPVGDNYCGEWEINHPIAGTESVKGQSLARFENTSVSSIRVINTYKYTVAYLGTDSGYLKKVVVETGTSAKEYEEVSVQPGSRINPDMGFDRSRMHLYVMTEKNVTKIKVQDCGKYTNCEDCLGAGDPYCGWCSLEKKCSLRSECEKPEEELRWLEYTGIQCPKIIQVLPEQVQIQKNEPSKLTLTIQNLPTPTEGNYQCAFSGHGVVRMTNAVRLGRNEPALGNHTIQCETPAFNLLPVFPTSMDHIVLKLSVRVNMKDFVSTNFTFFDCAKHYQCTTCTSSAFPCTWCVKKHSCTEKREMCADDVLVTGKNVLGPTDRPGPETCPRIGHHFREILVHDGVEKAISVKGENLESFQTEKLECHFQQSIKDVTVLDASYNPSDKTIECGKVEFDYGTPSPDLNVHFSVVWGEQRFKIDNPDNIQVKVFKCTQKATNCGNCLTIDSKYECGWCKNRCTIKQQCSAPNVWLDSNGICPNPKITTFSPLTGPKEGGTNLTIVGENLGKVYEDISSGVTVAGIACRVFQDQYVPATKIVCETGAVGPGEEPQSGPVTVIINNRSDYKGSSEEPFSYVVPSIKDFKPRKGPRSGGTYVTIEGVHMNAGTNQSATIAGVPCKVVRANEMSAVCVTSSSSTTQRGKVAMTLDKASISYEGEKEYSFVNDPNVTGVQPESGILSGGSTISVKGERFTSIQSPKMVVYYNGGEYTSNCVVIASDEMNCTSPSFLNSGLMNSDISVDNPLKMSYGFKLDNVEQVKNYTKVHGGKKKFTLFPDPYFKKFDGGTKSFELNTEYLTIDGANIDLALSRSDIRVKIGEEDCSVKSVSSQHLTCSLPPSVRGNEEDFQVRVEIGSNLSYEVGMLSFKTLDAAAPVFSFMNMWFIIGMCTAAFILIALIVIICVAYQRKSRESDRVMKRMQNQMDVLEARVAKECKEAFAELQTEMTDLTGDLGGSSGIPFRDYRSFAMCVLFPNVPVHDHPVTRPFEVEDLMDPSRMESVLRGLRLFNQLIGNKIFLLLFIRTLESDSTFTAREKVNVASLISATLQNRMEYHTDILKTLLAELIEKTMESRNHPKLLLRRTESVAEKMLSNWFTFLLYKFLKECAGEPLFMLYRAIKQQVDKGPVDIITSEAKYSLSEDKLIRQQIDYKTMTIHVLDPEIQYGTQEHAVKVLDCDTISQVKEKILDTIYKHAPFSTRPTINDLDLEWRTGVKGRLILQDDDMTTKPDGEFRRLNTLTHYKVPDGALMALVTKQSSMYNLSVTSDRTHINHSNHSNHRYGTMDLGYYTANSPSLGNSRSLSPHTIDIHLENGAKVFHLVKQHDIDIQKEGERGSKMVSEIYLTRLLATKGTLQTFVDNLFETIFSTASRVSVLPLAIKYMFDFLDDQALHHGIVDPEVVHTWKSNSLPLRFWISVVKNPDFVFDIHKSNIVDSCLSVVAQTFMDSCSMSEHRLGKDSPSSKLLYAKDIPKYKKWVERYYQDIKQMPAISDQDMNAMLAEESRLHESQFNHEAALYELYQYVVKYNEELMSTLEEDEFARNYRLAYRLDQVHAAMESEV